jgi:adenine deaminase
MMAQTKIELRRLIQAAMGKIKSDLIVTGGKVINVYSGEILTGLEMAIANGRICYIGPSAAHTQGSETRIVDARGLYVAPGFIDGHTHIGHYCRPFEQLQSFVPHGTTALVASCDELASVFGYRGLKFFLDEVERHPLRVYSLVSMVVPQDPLLCNTAAFSDEEFSQALADPRVLGVGEIVSWLRLIDCDEQLLERIHIAQADGRIIHGHTAGARDRNLCAVSAAGISSCHEPIRMEDALERLRLGYWTMLREGSLRQDLEQTLKPLIERNISCQRIMLVTDSMTPDDIEERGHMDYVVRRAISLGLSPVQAIQAVTVNPATYSGLDQEVGGLAPGRFADLVLIDDLERCHVREVLIGGEVVALDGISQIKRAPISLPRDMMHSLGLQPNVSADKFVVPCAAGSAKLRVIELINSTITAERIFDITSLSGFVEASFKEDLLKVAVFDRHRGSGKIAMAFLKGFGAQVGAVGLTVNLDENALMLVGSNDQDMAYCANALIECGGGVAIVNHGQVLEKAEFPLGGICSLDPWKKVGRRLRKIQACLRENGALFDKPLFPLSFLTFVTLPVLRITSRGLVNAKERKIVPLFVNGPV